MSLVLGEDGIELSVAHVEKFRKQIRDIEGYAIVSDSFDKYPDIAAHDPLRITFDVSGTNLTGA